ncbi:MAG: c-type cytochrome [Rhodospirillales bacterium]|nr:c-type cytochrome [Rhodospirillales bacterium]
MSTFRILFGIGAGVFMAAPVSAGGDAKNGSALFEENCAPCHYEFKSNGNNVGPNLSSVIGRMAGTFLGYDYSTALKAASHVWTEALLVKFLAGPNKMVPGTNMGFEGFETEANRRDVVAYIKQQQGK